MTTLPRTPEPPTDSINGTALPHPPRTAPAIDDDPTDLEDREPARVRWLETDPVQEILYRIVLPFVTQFTAIVCAGLLLFLFWRGYVQ